MSDSGGPAFPQNDASVNRINNHDGMTLRDYFAAKAMQAMVTKSSGQDTTGGKKGVPLIAKYAYEFADAMIEERSKA